MQESGSIKNFHANTAIPRLRYFLIKLHTAGFSNEFAEKQVKVELF